MTKKKEPESSGNVIPFPKPKLPDEVLLHLKFHFDEEDVFIMEWAREPPTLSDYNVAGLIVMILQQLAEDDPQIRKDFMREGEE